jgi:hypothetical protein
MMQLITNNAAPINSMMNAPGCIENHLPPGMDGPIDCEPFLRAGGFSVIGEGCGWLFNKVGIGTYEVHSSVLPEYRGPGTMTKVMECARTAFLETDAMEVVTRCPVTNKAAIKMAKLTGFIELYTAVGTFGGIDMLVYSLPLSVWAAAAKEFEIAGEAVHNEFLRHDADHAKHEHDSLHNQYAGITFEIAKNGWPEKGIHVYNVWAQMTGYQPIQLLSQDPIVVRVPWLRPGGGWEQYDYAVRHDGLELL